MKISCTVSKLRVREDKSVLGMIIGWREMSTDLLAAECASLEADSPIAAANAIGSFCPTKDSHYQMTMSGSYQSLRCSKQSKKPIAFPVHRRKILKPSLAANNHSRSENKHRPYTPESVSDVSEPFPKIMMSFLREALFCCQAIGWRVQLRLGRYCVLR